MSRLELKIPPVIVTLLFAGLIWLVAQFTPRYAMPVELRIALCITLLIASGAIGLAAVMSFSKTQTTVNPLKPETASFLVGSGIFAYTRNPMYLALLFALLAFCVFLENAFALALTGAFVLYMNRFQIRPEERAMERLFGAEFLEYRARVRRWI